MAAKPVGQARDGAGRARKRSVPLLPARDTSIGMLDYGSQM